MRLIILLSSLLWAAPLVAHDLQYRSDSAQATVLTLFYTDQKAFAYEQYELYRPGQNIPAQVGRTDDQGRLVFLPDQAGAWPPKSKSPPPDKPPQSPSLCLDAIPA